MLVFEVIEDCSRVLLQNLGSMSLCVNIKKQAKKSFFAGIQKLFWEKIN
jgi:hypothetical protein